MARYNTPPRDWSVKLPADLRKASRGRFTDCTLQQGVTVFSRKKKNGNRLASTSQIRRSINKTANKPLTTIAVAFPKMPL
jgi:hypothetical protein